MKLSYLFKILIYIHYNNLNSQKTNVLQITILILFWQLFLETGTIEVRQQQRT